MSKENNGGTPKSGKPVLVYIMILFIAAFLLMALSFAMHQRSNQEALGELETTFNATIKDMQADQDKLLKLQDQLSDTENELKNAQEAAASAQTQLDAADKALKAQQLLYALQQKFSAGEYEACDGLIKELERSGLADLLPSTQLSTDFGSVTAPYVRFQQLKEAVSAKLAE